MPLSYHDVVPGHDPDVFLVLVKDKSYTAINDLKDVIVPLYFDDTHRWRRLGDHMLSKQQHQSRNEDGSGRDFHIHDILLLRNTTHKRISLFVPLTPRPLQFIVFALCCAAMSFERYSREITERRDAMEELTFRIVGQLELGVKPWVRPWDAMKCSGPQSPFNAATGHRYSGVNVLVLGMDPRAFQTGDAALLHVQAGAGTRPAGPSRREIHHRLFVQAA